MTDDQLKMCLSELYSLALAKKPMKLVLVQCDTKIHEIKEWTNLSTFQRDIVKQTVKGRGGTDFNAFWQLLKTDRRFRSKRPDLIMLFTDGYVSQIRRDRTTMNWLCWCIIDNPSFNIENSDQMTKVIYLKTADIK
jgi:predicted metal-dependent peptidase